MKQFLKRIILRFRFGENVWNCLAHHFHKITKKLKYIVRKNRDFSKYVYPVIGRYPGKNDVFLVLSQTYKNLGDHAIAKAEMELFAGWGIICREITIDVIQILAKYNDYSVFGRSTVMVTGGGFIGSLWPHMQEMTAKIVEENPKSKIIILPNTLYFDRTPEDEKLFENSLTVFNQPNVKRFYLREKLSFNMVNSKYSTAKLMPDMVMSMNECRSGFQRSGCLICLRNDKERTLSESQTAVVYDMAKNLFGDNVKITDMRNDTDVSVEERPMKLEEKFNQFRNAELVITDRLHGMIFAAITGTACIVLNSRSHKLAGCYEWLKQLEYIRFCSNAEEIVNIYTSMPHGDHLYDMEHLRPWFEEMKTDLLSIINE